MRRGEAEGDNARRPPIIRDKEIWTKDYCKIDSVVFGASFMREVLDHHFPCDDAWPYHVLAFVDAVFNLERWGIEEVTACAQTLKAYVVGKMTNENRRDLSAVLLLVDLIQKTPIYRRSLND